MSRNLAAGIVSQLNNEGIRLAYLVKLETSTTILLTDHSKNITYDSDAYVADGSLYLTDEIDEHSDLQFSNINIELVNPTSTNKNIFLTAGYVNKAASVHCAFLDADETIIAAFEYFVGTISSATVADTTRGVVVEVELASHFRNWEIQRGRKYTDESQQSIFDGDKGMQFAHLAKNDLSWRA